MPKLVVAGASQGGVQALRTLIGGLPTDFPAAVLAVLHVGSSQSVFPSIINDLHGLPATHARDREPLKPSHVYVAPPDHHLLVTDAHLELSRGPRENFVRPAIDPLFRTAAEAYGPDVIGVVLTGRLNDGTSGLFEIKRRGGIAIVQDPDEAEARSMPRSALDNVDVDYCLPLSEIPDLLVRLAKENDRDQPYRGDMPMEKGMLARPAAQTCPECGGAMREEAQDSLTRFRCHIGHVMTAEVLAASQLEALEENVSSLLRMLNERVALCREMAEKARASGTAQAAERWRQAADEAAERERLAQRVAAEEWQHPEAEFDGRRR